MLSESTSQIYDVLLSEWDALDSDTYKIKPEILKVIRSHFPNENMVFDLGKAYQKINICASELQFLVENECPTTDPEEVHQIVMEFLIQVLGIGRAWEFMVKHGLVENFVDEDLC